MRGEEGEREKNEKVKGRRKKISMEEKGEGERIKEGEIEEEL